MALPPAILEYAPAPPTRLQRVVQWLQRRRTALLRAAAMIGLVMGVLHAGVFYHRIETHDYSRFRGYAITTLGIGSWRVISWPGPAEFSYADVADAADPPLDLLPACAHCESRERARFLSLSNRCPSGMPTRCAHGLTPPLDVRMLAMDSVRTHLADQPRAQRHVAMRMIVGTTRPWHGARDRASRRQAYAAAQRIVDRFRLASSPAGYAGPESAGSGPR